MKRLIYLGIGVIVLGVLAWFAYDLMKKSGTSDQEVAALNFEIKDTTTVDRIIITESNGMEYELVRHGKVWTDKDGKCVQQAPVFNILEALVNVRFKGYVPDKSMKMVQNRLTTIATKVQFFQNGEWSKTWYIGTSTPDHYGTFMLLETAAEGKSDLPVVTEIKGMQGMIGPRFFADPKRWMCTEIFSLALSEIDLVDVRFSTERQNNFTVQRSGKKFKVTSNGSPLPRLDTAMVYRYLNSYKKIHFELPNYTLSKRQVDSVKQSQPFCVLTVKTTSGQKQSLKMFRQKSSTGDMRVNDLGEETAYDVNRFWCLLPNKELVQCQYFVFNPLIMGHVYFNYGQQAPTQ